MKINDEIIQRILSELNEPDDGEIYYCYAVTRASAGKIFLFGTLSTLSNQYFLLGFSKTRLIMVKLSGLGNPKGHQVIPYSQLERVKVSNWMFGIGKKINLSLTDGSKIKLQINKKVFGIDQQSENLKAICGLLSERVKG